MMEAVMVLAMLFGLALIWASGYLKGRWDAGKSIGRRYNVTPR